MGGRRLLFGCALAALSGALLTLSFPPYDLWWLVWLAMVPMAVAEYRVLPAAWSALGPAIGVGGFMAGCFGGLFPDRAAWYIKVLPLLVTVIVFAVTRSSSSRAAGSARASASCITMAVVYPTS